MERGPRLAAWLSLMRPCNCLIIALATLTGGLMVSGPLPRLLLACASAAIIAASGNAINDYFDADVDAINKPHRPIPAGILSRRAVLRASLALAACGLVLAAFLGLRALTIAALATALLYAYSWRLKLLGLVGNLTIALLSALTFIYGGVASGALSPLLAFPCLFAFLIILGREIVKGVEDYEGDAVRDVRTLARILGPKAASYISTIPLALVIALSPLPPLLRPDLYGVAYAVIAFAGVDLPLAYAIYKMITWESHREVSRVRALTKIPLLFGVLAFLAEAI